MAQTQENFLLTISAPKNSLLGLQTDPVTRMASLADYFAGLANGSAGGRHRVRLHKGSASVIPSLAKGTVIAAAAAADDTITLNGSAITGKKQRASSTATLVTVLATQTVTINGIELTAVDADPTAAQFLSKVGGTDDTGSAVSLAAAINASTEAAKLTFTSIAAANTFKVNGITFTARATGATVATNKEFSIGADDTAAAVQAAACVNKYFGGTAGGVVLASSALGVVTFAPVNGSVFSLSAGTNSACTGIVGILTATSATNAVTVRATRPGDEGQNAYSLAASDATVTLSAATLAGGITVAAEQFETNGSSNAEVATDIVRCIKASAVSLISDCLSASNIASKVTLASVSVGDTITVDGTKFTACIRTSTEVMLPEQFDQAGNDTQDAANFVTQFNAHPKFAGRAFAMSTAGVVLIHWFPEVVAPYPTITSSNGSRLAVVATAATDTVRIISTVEGVQGNQATLASSNGTRLAVSAARLAGGVGANGYPSTVFRR